MAECAEEVHDDLADVDIEDEIEEQELMRIPRDFYVAENDGRI